MAYDVERIRRKFPALAEQDNGMPRVYLDNPAGTQVPDEVLDRINRYYRRQNANLDGAFSTSIESNGIYAAAHEAMKDFYNAASAKEIVFGANMTTLTFSISNAIGDLLSEGDEIILTRMDHDGNVSPWLALAERKNLNVKWISVNTDTYRMNLDELDDLLTPRTKLAAVNYASNITGTISDVREISRRVRSVGGLTYVDAVQFAAHGNIDVQALGCDFLVSSPYKFFGPHAGVLWGREDLLLDLKARKVKASGDYLPSKFETGTQNFEMMAGTIGAVEYFAWVGREMAAAEHWAGLDKNSRKDAVIAGKNAMLAHDEVLTKQLLAGLVDIPGIEIYGITNPEEIKDRVGTVCFNLKGVLPEQIAREMAKSNIFVWHGDNYALELMKLFNTVEIGGVLRVGLVHYNTAEEIAFFLEQMNQFVAANG